MASAEVRDLWWLPERHGDEPLLLGVAHCGPVSHRQGLPRLWCSLLPSGRPSEEERLYPLSFLDDWRRRWEDVNVFRTLCVCRGQRQAPPLLGPFCVDIDAELQSDGSCDLEDAAAVARTVVGILEQGRLGEDDFRILFTGRKGFNIEVRPEALGLASDADTRDLAPWRDKLRQVIQELRARNEVTDPTTNVVTGTGTVIDHFVERFPPHRLKRSHRHLRLTDSKNAWLDQSGRWRVRMKRIVSRHELFTNSAGAIAEESGRAEVNRQ